jgi:hypothetical protein
MAGRRRRHGRRKKSVFVRQRISPAGRVQVGGMIFSPLIRKYRRKRRRRARRT